MVPQGRAFLRRVYDLFNARLKSYHHIRITKEVKRDLDVWLMFFENFNGRCLFQRRRASDRWLVSDASGSIGFGLLFGGIWAYGTWPDEWLSYGITFKEMFPVALTVCKWAHLVKDSVLMCESDNMVVVQTINAMTSKCPLTMVLVRRLALTVL